MLEKVITESKLQKKAKDQNTTEKKHGCDKIQLEIKIFCAKETRKISFFPVID